MRKLLLFVPAAILALGTWLTYQPPPHKLQFVPSTATATPDALAEVRQIDEYNRRVADFSAQAHISVSNRRVPLSAEIRYRRPDKAHVAISSPLGTEADMGTNESIFWFWSKRLDRSTVFFAPHSATDKANLKAPIKPQNLVRALGLGDIASPGCTAGRVGDRIIVTKPTPNGKAVTVVDPARKCAIGNYLYRGDALEAFGEITEHTRIGGVHLPKTVVVSWATENVEMTWSLSGHQTRPDPQETYAPPDRGQKKDISRDL